MSNDAVRNSTLLSRRSQRTTRLPTACPPYPTPSVVRAIWVTSRKSRASSLRGSVQQLAVAAPACLEESGARRVVAVMTRPYGCGLNARAAPDDGGVLSPPAAGASDTSAPLRRAGGVMATDGGRRRPSRGDRGRDDETHMGKSVKKRQRCSKVSEYRIQMSERTL